MNDELREVLETEYRYAREAQAADAVEAEEARATGEMPRYFDLSLYFVLADACWALERWEEARKWYRHNAEVMTEKRTWYSHHGARDYPPEATSDWEASTFVKAGFLQPGRQRVRQAIDHWKREPGSELVLTRLGLHAAQVGMTELAEYSRYIVGARQNLPGEEDVVSRRARALLHYEPAQASLLLGRWNSFHQELERLEEGAEIVEVRPGAAFPQPMKEALVAATRGFRVLASLKTGDVEPKEGREAATDAFEAAMLEFYRFSGQIDWNQYFMRLNARFADELAAGGPLQPNPLATEGTTP